MSRSDIEWCDYTWNPVTGCRHGCPYCYAARLTKRFSGDVRLNKMAQDDYQRTAGGLYVLDKPMLAENGKPIAYPFGFEPTFHRYRLDELDGLGRGRNIFIGAMADLFGEWVPDDWIAEIFARCEAHPQHNYLFLTKNPKRYRRLELPAGDNFWYGCTITGGDPECLTRWLPSDRKTFVSVEPLLEDVKGDWLGNSLIDWVIIGAETGNRKGRIIPEIEWVDRIEACAGAHGIPVFMKDSLIPLALATERRFPRHFPPELKRTKISPKMQDKLYAQCCVCGQHLRKSEMVTLMARRGREEQPKQYGWMCAADFGDFCERYELENITERGKDDG